MARYTLPFDFDITVSKGGTYRQGIRWRYEDGTPINLSGYDAWMPFGPSNSKPPIGELNVSNGGITLTSTGYIEIYMSAEETTELASFDMPVFGEVGQLVYNLSLKQPNGDVIRFMRGNLYVQWDVERPK